MGQRLLTVRLTGLFQNQALRAPAFTPLPPNPLQPNPLWARASLLLQCRHSSKAGMQHILLLQLLPTTQTSRKWW